MHRNQHIIFIVLPSDLANLEELHTLQRGKEQHVFNVSHLFWHIFKWHILYTFEFLMSVIIKSIFIIF